jgi:hypothetical protein
MMEDQQPSAIDAAGPASLTPRPGRVGKGLLIGFALQLLLLPVILLAVFIGVVQLAYIIPTARYFIKRGETATVKGIYIAAAIVALLNVTCWGAALYDVGRHGIR